MIKKSSWVLLYITIGIIVIFSCFSITDFSFHDEKRAFQTFPLMLGSILYTIFFSSNKLHRFNTVIKVFFLLFLVLLIASSIFSALPMWAFLEIGWYFSIVCLLLLFAFLYGENKEFYIKIILIGLITLCIVYVARVFADYIIGTIRSDWTTWPQQRSFKIYIEQVLINPSGFLGFSHVRFFNHLQTWSLPLLVFGYLYFKDKIIPGLRYLLLFFISSWWMLVFAADARGTMLASIASLIVIVLLFRKKTFLFLKIYGSTAIAGLVLYFVLFLLPKESSREILTRFGDSGRWDVWLFSLEQIAQNPWLGLGPMHFSYMGINPPWSTPHNFLLQSASEWGIPAVLIFTGLSLYGYYHFTKQSLEITRHEENVIKINWRIALIASITAVIVHSMFSGIFNTPLSQLLGAIILSAALGEYYNISTKDFYSQRKKRSWAVYIIIFILASNTAFIGFKVYSDVPQLNERKAEYFESYKSKTLYPRFWEQGLIYKQYNERQENGDKENQDGLD